MAQLKDVQNKISAVKKTKQITKAMNMVAASKLRGSQQDMEAFRPYAAKFSEVLGSLAEKSGGEETSPLLTPREEVKKINIILLTSDRGLCGGFNSNLISKANVLMKEKSELGTDFSFTAFGKKGRDWCRKNKFEIESEHIGVVGGRFGFNVASITGGQIIDDFVNGKYDEVYIVCSEFYTVARQLPVVKQILPIPRIEKEEEAEAEEKPYLAEHIAEPSAAEVMGEMLPRNVYVQIYNALLETSTSEHAARMTAMDNATKACNDMIENLTLAFNKARQAAITADLMDIVGGAEALKG